MRLGEAARAAGIAGLVDLVPTFRSLMVHYDPTVTSRPAVEQSLRGLLTEPAAAPPAGRLWEFPVLYGREARPDLHAVRTRPGLAPGRVREVAACPPYAARPVERQIGNACTCTP